ncbi:MAG: LacI family DNA-binding transcriptional regulator [Firmicutes bacterium]|nr:LacI family DNA-binding transcriptional regulator [Bacillota bacterium]
MSVTIKDIANAAGVGIATVSRVLNNSGAASSDVREKVMKAVRELNYIPNNNARNLKLGHSKTIVLLAKSIVNPFFQKMIPVIERQVMLRGYNLDIRNVSYSESEMEVARCEVLNRNLCGIIIMGGKFGYCNEDFEALKVPCVLVTIKASKEVDESLYSSVIIDDVAETKKAVDYLVELGHRRIGCIANSYQNITTPNHLRFCGYKKALECHGIPFDSSLVSTANIADSGYAFGFNMMKSMLARNRDMTAVVTMADVMAIGAAKAAFTEGLRVPEDISVVGFDGIEESDYYNPSLDTIVQPAQPMAQQTVDSLFEMIQGGPTSHIVLEGTLVKRGSCGRVVR